MRTYVRLAFHANRLVLDGHGRWVHSVSEYPLKAPRMRFKGGVEFAVSKGKEKGFSGSLPILLHQER